MQLDERHRMVPFVSFSPCCILYPPSDRDPNEQVCYPSAELMPLKALVDVANQHLQNSGRSPQSARELLRRLVQSSSVPRQLLLHVSMRKTGLLCLQLLTHKAIVTPTVCSFVKPEVLTHLSGRMKSYWSERGACKISKIDMVPSDLLRYVASTMNDNAPTENTEANPCMAMCRASETAGTALLESGKSRWVQRILCQHV